MSIEDLEPKAVWKFFRGLAAVPRPSKREEKIRAHMRSVLAELGFTASEDPTGNIVAQVPATPGHEGAALTVIQSHLDMVCEKNEGTQHDFDEDPIKLLEGKDKNGEFIVHAAGTTLGADNGMGVAMSLAAASSPEVVHGPLELLFTTDEETGMTGAKALTPQSFAARRLLNLDSEEDDSLYIGCAGGRDTDLAWDVATSAPAAGTEMVELAVTGLRGGHSGCDIHENRGNAIQLLARTLDGIEGLQLASITGGSMRNAIPREAKATFALSARAVDGLKARAATIEAAGRKEFFEEGLRIEARGASAAKVATVEDSARVLAALRSVPSGVVGLHPRSPDLVQTSNNLSTVNSSVEAQRLRINAGCLTRSSLVSSVDRVCAQLVAIAGLAGATASHANDYPGWEPRVDSPLLDTTKSLYQELFGDEPKVLSIHAGLECGIIRDRVGEMDMISFGPRIEGAHSPDERVYPDSVAKSYRFLVAVLGALAS